MSLAGIRSARGDAYQIQVALDWTIRLLTDPDVLSVQFESLGGADGGLPPLVDDVVIQTAERTIYVQAKKNEPARGVWGGDPSQAGTRARQGPRTVGARPGGRGMVLFAVAFWPVRAAH